MKHDEIRELAEADLEAFIALVAPHLQLGECHRELIRWWTSSARKDNIMVLLPRGHLKSKLMAYKTVWELTKEPDATILYVSATKALAQKQLYLMKQILESHIYRRYWPEMVNAEEAKREKWSATEIAVDHPKRKSEGIRDPSILAASLKTNITGFHATKVKLDDVVVPANAYTEEGRQQVASSISQIASIKEPEATMDCVGTRYHGKDQYATFLKQSYKVYDDDTGEVMDEEEVWDSWIKVVETGGDFLWPRARRDDGKYFGFNSTVLSKIKAEYEDRTQFFAQYYQNPNDPESARVDRSKFQYYDRKALTHIDDRWFIHGQPLAVYAGIDFAYTLGKRSDFTSLAVVGVTPDNQYYVLDIIRFKSDKIKDYFDCIMQAYSKWGFQKLRAEVVAAQKVIVRDLKENYIVPMGLRLSVDEYAPTRHQGSKEERVAATLEPKYDNLLVWHYQGGEITALEDELIQARPPHDDCKDALTAAIDIAQPPRHIRGRHDGARKSNVVFSSRFGGVAYK
jgi:phage terminase large subunit-like protein